MNKKKKVWSLTKKIGAAVAIGAVFGPLGLFALRAYGASKAEEAAQVIADEKLAVAEEAGYTNWEDYHNDMLPDIIQNSVDVNGSFTDVVADLEGLGLSSTLAEDVAGDIMSDGLSNGIIDIIADNADIIDEL